MSRGIGKDLLNYCLHDLKNYTYQGITIDVHEKNLSAINLYKQIGFTEKTRS